MTMGITMITGMYHAYTKSSQLQEDPRNPSTSGPIAGFQSLSFGKRGLWLAPNFRLFLAIKMPRGVFRQGSSGSK